MPRRDRTAALLSLVLLALALAGARPAAAQAPSAAVSVPATGGDDTCWRPAPVPLELAAAVAVAVAQAQAQIAAMQDATVGPSPTVAVATADVYATPEDWPLVVAARDGVLANDRPGPSGVALSAVLLEGPAHGTLALGADGAFTYTPAPNYAGPDRFTYAADGGGDGRPAAVVTLTVLPLSPAQELERLVGEVRRLAVTCALTAEEAGPLLALLAAAQVGLDAGPAALVCAMPAPIDEFQALETRCQAPACDHLAAFAERVAALGASGVLRAEPVRALREAATNLAGELACP